MRIPSAPKFACDRQALTWIREICERQQPNEAVKIFYFEDLDDVVLRALRSEARVLQGLELATVLKSARSQQALFFVASTDTYSLDLRTKAADAFEKSVQTFGVLLRGLEVQQIYDRYNASAEELAETQKLLSRLIDIVEDKVLQQKPEEP